jgi:hypothetical protein
MKKKFKRAPEQMDWPTYNAIQSLIEAQMEVLKREYSTACMFIPTEPYDSKRLSGFDKAHKIFSDRWAELRRMKEQLHTTAAAAYKTHPLKEMREFWGLTE